MNRGDVLLAALEPRSGSEQRGTRPCVLVSHDVFNRNENWRSILLVPVSTSSKQGRRGPTSVLLPKGAATGLHHESYALCHQVTTLDRSKIVRNLGALPANTLEKIEDGLKLALGMI